MRGTCRWVLVLAGTLLVPAPALAQDFAAKGFKLAPPTPHELTPDDVTAGRELYAENCMQCHGEQGDGQGPMADLLDPRPRDFRRAIYKIRRTPQGELPTDQDLFRIISNGMTGTSMPEWRGLLSEEQIWQLVGYLKSFSEEDFADYPPEQEFQLEGLIDPTPESVARGAEIYEKAECAKCHGVAGRGNGPSAATLEDEWEFRIFPANLTQPWTLRGGSSATDLYRAVATGVNGTPMPSFSDAWEAEDLWHLANFLHSIGRVPAWGEINRALKSDSIPTDPFAEAWDLAPPLDIRLAGQIIQEPRLFNPSVQGLTVRSMFDDEELALLLTWDDRFENNAGEEPNDRVSVLFSARELEDGKKPYFLMGDRRRPVDNWQWSAAGGGETFLARGMDAVTPRASPVTAQGVFRDGQYRVILRRSLMSSQEDEVAFIPGQMIPIAFNVWDGENAEVGKQRAISRWYYLLLQPETPWTTYVWPLLVVVLTGSGEVFGLRRLRRQWASGQSDAAAPEEVSLS